MSRVLLGVWSCCVSGGESNSQNGYTALMDATAKGHTDCVRLLIDAGADKEAKDWVRCWSPFPLVYLLVLLSLSCSYAYSSSHLHICFVKFSCIPSPSFDPACIEMFQILGLELCMLLLIFSFPFLQFSLSPFSIYLRHFLLFTAFLHLSQFKSLTLTIFSIPSSAVVSSSSFMLYRHLFCIFN